jgi:hypothetical protein
MTRRHWPIVTIIICALTSLALTKNSLANTNSTNPARAAVATFRTLPTGETVVMEPAYDPALAASVNASLPVAQQISAQVQNAPFPNSQTFLLHSRSGASKVIYLDFTGDTTPAGINAWGPYVGTQYDTNGVPGSFAQSEHDQMQSIWQRVAEDFAPFDVDVTTEEPTFEAIDRGSLADLNFGTRVAIVSSPSTPICTGCGGAAIQDSFDTTVAHKLKQPVWVFEKNLVTTKAIAEAVSHEVGHTLGLIHDTNCGVASPTPCPNLYQGHANWAPIMGLSYYRPVTQWARGQYPQHDHTNNEIFTLSSKLGWVPDGPIGSTPIDMGVVSTSASIDGISGYEADVDAWSTIDHDFYRFFAPTAGTYTVSATPAPTSPNLDISMTVFDGANLSVTEDPVSGMASADVATGMNATLSLNLLQPGWHTVAILPAETDFSGTTGYSQYGTMGTYKLTVTQTAESGDSFAAVPDARLLDTRPTPIAVGATTNLTVTGVAGVPANATAVVLNVTAVSPLGAGHLRVFPAGTPRPDASVLNFGAGRNTPNQVIARVGRVTPTSPGQVSIYAGNTTNVLVDISGYFVADDAKNQFIPVPAVALPSTEYLLPAAVPGNPSASTVNVQVLGVGGIPSAGEVNPIAKVAVSVTATNPTGNGHIRVFPTGGALPPTSTNNFIAGDSRTNLVTVAPGTDGKISLYNASPGSVSVSVLPIGYFAQGGLGFKPLDPVRPLDTRITNPGLGLVSLQNKVVQIRGYGGVPDSPDVKAVLVNIAAVTPTQPGTVQLDYTSTGFSPPPKRRAVLFPANQNVANLAIATVGPQGTIRVQNDSVGRMHIIVDIVGYFTD